MVRHTFQRNWSLAFFVIVLLTCGISRTWADGVIRDGTGAISMGRGGTNIAFSDNGGIILDNPAGMTGVECCGLSEISLDGLLTDLHYMDPQNSVDGEVKLYPMGHLALTRKLNDPRFSVGLGVFTPAGFGAEYDMAHPVLGTTRQKSFAAVVKVLPSIAYQVTDQFSIGGSFGVAASHVELEGPFHLQTGAFAGTPTLLDVQATGAAATWNFGIQYKLSDWTTFGASYTSKTEFNMDGNASAFVPGLGQSRMDADVGMRWPRSVGMGLAYAPWEDTTLSVDTIWYGWSSAFDQVDMTLSGFTNPAFSAVLGPTVQERFPLNWRDSISIRTGLEQRISESHVVRAGYVYHHNPIPTATMSPYIAGTLEHLVSLGYGVQMLSGEFNFAYQYSWGRTQFVSTSGILGGDFNNSQLDAAAHFLSMAYIKRF